MYSTIDERCYVGSSKDLYKRINAHLCALRKNKHTNSKLQNFVNKYGLDVMRVEVLLLCKQRDLCDNEDEQRKLYNSYHRGFDLLEYSYRPTGFTYTAEQKANLSLIQKGNLERDLPGLLKNLEKARIGFKIAYDAGLIRATFTGKKHKAESKVKMREAKVGKSTSRKGTNFTTNPGQPVYCLTKTSERLDYKSAQIAAKETGIEYKTLQQRIKYGRVGRDGSRWFYTDPDYRSKQT